MKHLKQSLAKLVRAIPGAGAFLAAISLFAMPLTGSAQVPVEGLEGNGDSCHGKFPNPIKDVCWDCLFPISLGSVEMTGGPKDFGNPSSPVCACTTPIPRIGLAMGFWEPVKLVDATQESWCFASMAGTSLDPGIGYKDRASVSRTGGDDYSSWQVHWYDYPLMYLLGLLTKPLCAKVEPFNIGYVTELDPTWHNDALSLILTPETMLFANPLAVTSCSADCASVMATGMGMKELFWCHGCQGLPYPASGNIGTQSTHYGGGIASAQRGAFKLHRALVEWKTSTPAALCEAQPDMVMDKRQYRWQNVSPRPHLKGPFVCPSTGQGPSLVQMGRNRAAREDLGWLVWKKRNCCVG